jgi:hypothetical protein
VIRNKWQNHSQASLALSFLLHMTSQVTAPKNKSPLA